MIGCLVSTIWSLQCSVLIQEFHIREPIPKERDRSARRFRALFPLIIPVFIWDAFCVDTVIYFSELVETEVKFSIILQILRCTEISALLPGKSTYSESNISLPGTLRTLRVIGV
jgi:hypothetical protein